MKSTIDWNEIIPRLPKELRDSLYLEAVSLLSDLTTGETREELPKKGHGMGNYRKWADYSDGHQLAKPGRKYRINRNSTYAPRNGSIGTLWNMIKKNEFVDISYEQIAAFVGNVPGLIVASSISRLWSLHAIDIEK